MFYLILSVINIVYGGLLFSKITTDTPGFFLTIFIAAVLTIVGLIGFVLWLRETITSRPASQSIALKNWFQLTRGIDILLILGLLFRTFILQPFLVSGNSMEPNYHDNEFLLVDRISYKFKAPKRGDVIIFRYPKNPKEDYIKRIIGLPFDTVVIDDGQIYVNDNLISEPYFNSLTTTNLTSNSNESSTVTLGENEYFVLGDNRNNSSDSRMWGSVPKANIIGRVWLVVWPWQYFGLIKNPI